MPPIANMILLLLAAYVVGSIPFGYLIARLKGVDIFKVGSGNVGATNVGRVLGRKFGLLVFVLDFLKGVAPVLAASWYVRNDPAFADWQPMPNLAVVGSAVATFLGHLFPVFLKLRGGKGVATGAGAALSVAFGPAAFAFLVWFATVGNTGLVSLASIAAMVAFMVGHTFNAYPDPFAKEHLAVSLFCYCGSLLVILKHRANIGRLRKGTENRLEPSSKREQFAWGLHLLALGLVAGASVFFHFVVGPSVFQSFKEVASHAPSDRTAQVAINAGLDAERIDQLGRALGGAAVGPLFGPYFRSCSALLVLAAIGAWGTRWHLRWILICLGLLLLNWAIAGEVSRLRLERYSEDAAVAEAAKNAFGTWHVVSLLLNLVTTVLACLALATAQPRSAAVAKPTPAPRASET